MAQEVAIPNANSNAKVCKVVGVGALSLIPFYMWIWWYRANRELADLGKTRGTDELGTSPGKSLLAVTLGSIIIVPAVMTYFSTHKRIVAAQKLAGQTPINGWISLILYSVFSPAWMGYMQSGLNTVWTNVAAIGDGSAPVDATLIIETSTEQNGETRPA